MNDVDASSPLIKHTNKSKVEMPEKIQAITRHDLAPLMYAHCDVYPGNHSEHPIDLHTYCPPVSLHSRHRPTVNDSDLPLQTTINK